MLVRASVEQETRRRACGQRLLRAGAPAAICDDGEMASECAFCAVIRGETAAAVVYEDAGAIAFLDHRPLFPGHCLLTPREHVETLADLRPSAVGPLFSAARILSIAVEEVLGAEGSFVAVNNRVSQSVPHLHVHVVPRRRKDGLRGFFWPRATYADDSAREQVRARIAAIADRLKPSA
jgi:histidine triad (HIT) family protein